MDRHVFRDNTSRYARIRIWLLTLFDLVDSFNQDFIIFQNLGYSPALAFIFTGANDYVVAFSNFFASSNPTL